MNMHSANTINIKIPKGFIVFISGVPGVGKTTISYELLKSFNDFRIVEETDLIREILRGYNEYIESVFQEKASFLFDKIEIADHTKFLLYSEAYKQCEHIKNSLDNIIKRQKRKGISTIINGVHIIPEVLNGLYNNDNIIYINLFVNTKQALFNRWKEREPAKYNLQNLSIAFKTNIELSKRTLKLSKKMKNIFWNIDVTNLSIEETKSEIIRCIVNRLQNYQA